MFKNSRFSQNQSAFPSLLPFFGAFILYSMYTRLFWNKQELDILIRFTAS